MLTVPGLLLNAVPDAGENNDSAAGGSVLQAMLKTINRPAAKNLPNRLSKGILFFMVILSNKWLQATGLSAARLLMVALLLLFLCLHPAQRHLIRAHSLKTFLLDVLLLFRNIIRRKYHDNSIKVTIKTYRRLKTLA